MIVVQCVILVIYNTKKECFRSLRDSYVNRTNLKDKRNDLRSFYEKVYDEHKVPSTDKMTSTELDQAFLKINPYRLISNNIEYWDVPSSLGGLKLY